MDRIVLVAKPTERESVRPLCGRLCGHVSARVHSTCVRRLADLPWQGKRTELQVFARRFRCSVITCRRRIFTERLPDVALPKARRSGRHGGDDHRRLEAAAWKPPSGRRRAWLPTQSAEPLKPEESTFVAGLVATAPRGFADGLMRDEAAVRAAITEPWSTSPVERRINRLNGLKRQMHGREKHNLLRSRVLAAA